MDVPFSHDFPIWFPRDVVPLMGIFQPRYNPRQVKDGVLELADALLPAMQARRWRRVNVFNEDQRHNGNLMILMGFNKILYDFLGIS